MITRNNLKERFFDEQLEKNDTLRRKDLQEEDREKQDQRRIPLVSKNN